MNYIGSKFKLSHFILNGISQNVAKPLNECIFCDLFAGTGAVGRLFKSKVKKVIANDKEFYSFVLNKNYIGNHKTIPNANVFLEKLNRLNGIEGKIYSYYSQSGTKNKEFQRLYFSDENALKIDAIRQEIEHLKEKKRISLNLYYFLLASLLESADKVANVACVYAAYLKAMKRTAQKKMELKAAEFELNKNEHEVFNENANDLITKISGDILYLDPPYNSREYGANYHLLNSIALYDDFIPKGKTGLRTYETSAFCKKNQVANALEDLINKADFEWIFLSYNDEGLIHFNEVRSIFEKYGNYSVLKRNYQRFKADNQRMQKQDSTIEYLHVLNKDKAKNFFLCA